MSDKLKVTKITHGDVYYVRTNEDEYDNYERHGPGGWNVIMGCSTEEVYNTEELEAAFQEKLREQDDLSKADKLRQELGALQLKYDRMVGKMRWRPASEKPKYSRSLTRHLVVFHRDMEPSHFHDVWWHYYNHLDCCGYWIERELPEGFELVAWLPIPDGWQEFTNPKVE